MLKTRSTAVFAASLIFFAILNSCTKIDTTSLGQSLIPGVDNIHTFDTTFDVIAVNYDDLAACDTAHSTALQALGIISNDPYFGTTEASIYAEVLPPTFPYTFPSASSDSLFIDSVVVILPYSHTFGDTLSPQKVNVYQLDDTFDSSKNYTVCTALGYNSSVLYGEKTFIPARLKDSIHGYNEDAANQLRIPLQPFFAQQMLEDSSLIFQSKDAFRNFLRGFALVGDKNFPGQQSINYFDFTSSDCRLAIYVRATKSGVTDTLALEFPMSYYNSPHANSVIRDRTNAEMLQHLSQPETGDSLIYIQASPGSYALLTIPGITGLSNRVINRAELIVDQTAPLSPVDNILTPPANLYLEAKDPSISTDSYIPIPCDFIPSDLNTTFLTMGGMSKDAKDNQGNAIKEYTFNISRYLQSIATKKKDNLLLKLSAPHIVSYNLNYTDWCGQYINSVYPSAFLRNSIADGRVRINGTNKTPTRIRLHVVYSVL